MGDPGMPDQPQGIGMSGIWAPDGTCLMRLGRAEEVGIVDVPVDEVSAYRSRLGVLHNRVKGIDYDACGR